MKKRVLIVEDDPGNIEVMRDELKMLGYEVSVAKNGLEAIEAAEAEIPDLIVMDIIMPKMDGLEAAAEIRKNPQTRQIPILAATAKGLPEDKDSYLAAGCDDYLAKPFNHKELKAAIDRLLKRGTKK